MRNLSNSRESCFELPYDKMHIVDRNVKANVDGDESDKSFGDECNSIGRNLNDECDEINR